MPQVKAIKDNILCIDGDFGDQTTQSGLIIKSNIGKDEGIRPRWFKIFETGPEITDMQPGQWVYVEYGRWTEGMKLKDDRFETENNEQLVWKVDPKACLAVADEKPNDIGFGQYTSFKGGLG